MIQNQWYAVLNSKDLKKNKLLAVRRFGEDLIFFRTSNGEASAVTSLCAHRGASLCNGWIENDNIKCPFHGIEYDSTGKCVYVPSDGRASTQDYSRFNLKHYPTREIGGIIFAWLGEKEPDKEPDVFDIITDSSYTYDHVEDTWSVQYSRVIENQLDVSHLAFVHHNTIGRGNKTLCNGPKVEWLDNTTMRTSADNMVDTGQAPKSSDEAMIKSTNLTFKFPNIWLNHVTDKIQILAFFIPVDEEHSIIALRFYNKITGFKPVDKLIAWLGSRANKVVERQDKRIVETQLPKKTDLAMKESLAPADLPIIEYRSKRKELQRKELQRKETLTMNTKAMYKISYGLYICTAVQGDKKNGCIINTAIQVASDPNRISIAINKANLTHDMVRDTGLCNISVLSTDATFDIFKHFGFQTGKIVDKFSPDRLAPLLKELSQHTASNQMEASINSVNGQPSAVKQDNSNTSSIYNMADNGIPYITAGTNAYFSLKVEQQVDLGSHTLFICEPTFMTVLSDAPSCTYEFYQNQIKPKPQPVGQTPKGETIWRCVICGYEYVGEELPDDFICPICKHGKEDFEKIIR